MPPNAQNNPSLPLTKRAFVSVAAILFSGALMFASRIGISFLLEPLRKYVFAERVISEAELFFWNVLLYLLMFVPSAVFLCIFFRAKPFSCFRERPDVPGLYFAYLPAVLGLCYAFNLLVNLLLGDVFSPFTPEQAADDFSYTAIGILLDFVFTAVLPAITEEWFFRGVCLKNLLPFGSSVAVISSSLLFGLMHDNPIQTLAATFFGLIAGYTYLQTGSLWFGVLIHFMNNCVSLGISYWTVAFDSLPVMFGLYVWIMIGFSAVTLFFYIKSRKKEKHEPIAHRKKVLNAKQTCIAVFLNPMTYLLIGFYIFLLYF